MISQRIVVLDDDPTGTQTVHDVKVYTDWSEETLRAAFATEEPLFFVLTNSRSFSREKTIRVHREIGQRLKKLAEEFHSELLVISRSDSTLRGHFPYETEALAEGLGQAFDGEVIMPFFLGGKRFTKGNIHYVGQDDGSWIPAGETEFAQDKTFGFRSSDLCEWVEEKTNGQYPKEQCLTIPLGSSKEEILKILLSAKDFQKIIVNAVSFDDAEVFCSALREALKAGKRYLYRTAADFPRIMGGISQRPLLEAKEICDMNTPNGGLVLIGSHVPKSTRQFESLRSGMPDLAYMEFDVRAAMAEDTEGQLAKQAAAFAEKAIRSGKTAVIYTGRTYVDLPGATGEQKLAASVRVSDALTSIPSYLNVRPRYLIAKGGITSSDTATRGLNVHCATVLGQAINAVPVWQIGEESRFPGMAYVIFPGNVGNDNSLLEIVRKLETRNAG